MPAGGLATAALIAGGAKALWEIGSGVDQSIKGHKLAKNLKRPWMEIPEAATRGLENAKFVASQTQLPGHELIEQKIGSTFSNYANALEKAAPSTGTMLNDLNMGYQTNINQLTDLGIAGAKNWQENQGVLRNELDNMANWEQKKFMYNFDEPYRNKAAAASALKGAGMQNINTALTDTAGMLATGANIQGMNNSFDEFLKSLNKPTPVTVQTPTGATGVNGITTKPVGYDQGTPVNFIPRTTGYNWVNFPG